MLTREQLEALPEEDLRALWSHLMSIFYARRSRRTGRPVSPAARAGRLAALAVGESHLFEGLTRPQQICSSDKAQARKQLGAPTAQWEVRTTTKGVRATRLA